MGAGDASGVPRACSTRSSASGADVVDAAEQYAQHIPVRVIAEMLGVPAEDGDKFRRFIHRIIEAPGEFDEDPSTPRTRSTTTSSRSSSDHRANPRDDLVGFLMNAEMDGEPLSDQHIGGTIALLLIAGIDTTWSAIGASLWHLAQHPERPQAPRRRPRRSCRSPSRSSSASTPR